MADRVDDEWAPFTDKLEVDNGEIARMLSFSSPLRIAVAGDIFAPGYAYWRLDEVFAAMWMAERHRFLIVTENPQRAKHYIESGGRTFLWEQHVMNARLQRDPSFVRKLPPIPLPNVRISTPGRPILIRGIVHDFTELRA